MERIKEKRTLTINCLSDDMLQCAIKKGFKIPCVSISHYYGKPAIFAENYDKEGNIKDYTLTIYRDNNKFAAMYCMEK